MEEALNMGTTNHKNDYESNLNKLVRGIAIEDGVSDCEDIEGYLFAVKEKVNEWTFIELDNIYENGVSENDSILTDVLFAIAAGYALLLRYNLERIKYQEWAKKQGKYKDYLLEIIGVKRVEKKKVENKISNKKEPDILSELNERKRIIRFSENRTQYTLLGKYIKISNKAQEISELFTALEKAKKFSLSILKSGLKNRCKDYKECSANINSVLQDATDAAWVTCKKFFSSRNILEETINKYNEEYKSSISEIYSVKERLDEALLLLKEKAEDKIENINEQDRRRRDRVFSGGGTGIGSMVAGMVAADVLASANSAWANARLKTSAEKLYNEILIKANEIYLGEGTLKLYEEIVLMANEELENLCINKFYSDEVEKQSNVNLYINKVREMEKEVSCEQFKDMVSLLLFNFPFTIDTYRLLFSLFIDAREELIEIAKIFGLEERIIKWNSEVRGSDEDQMVFSDIVLSRKNVNDIEVDGLKYNDRKFIIYMKNVFADVKLNDIKVESDTSYAKKVTFIYNEEIVALWGGCTKYGFEDKNADNIIGQINTYSNIRVKENSEGKEIYEDKSDNIIVFEANLLSFREKYVGYIQVFIEEDIIFSVFYGKKNADANDKQKYYESVKNIKLDRQINQIKTEFSYLTKAEVFKKMRKNAQLRANKYFEKYKYGIDIGFRTSFRKIFKALIIESNYFSKVLNKYDYEVTHKDILKLLEDELEVGQYILYYSKVFMITDCLMVIYDEKRNIYKFHYDEICEIFPIESYFGGAAKRLCITKKDGDYEVLYISEESLYEYVFISGLLNIAMSVSTPQLSEYSYRTVIEDKEQEYVFCSKCKKIGLSVAEEGMLIRHVHCKKCGTGSSFLNRFVKDVYYEKFIKSYETKINNYEKRGLFISEDEFERIIRDSRKEIDIDEIIKIGNDYYDNKQYIKAKNVYLLGLSEEPFIRKIIEQFYRGENKIGIVKELEKYVQKKGDIDIKEYSGNMRILANIKKSNEENILLYAAESRNTYLVDELIRFGANVDTLYRLLGQEVESDEKNSTSKIENRLCKNCGKEISSTAKFCNYCGEKTN